MQKSSIFSYVTIVAFFVISSLSTLSASEDITDINNELQPELSTLLNSLSSEEQEQCMHLLNEAAQLIQENEMNPEPETSIYTFMSSIDVSGLSIFAVQMVCAIIFWEIIKPHLEARKEVFGTRSVLEGIATFVTILCIDDIKDLLKEAKKASKEKWVQWKNGTVATIA